MEDSTEEEPEEQQTDDSEKEDNPEQEDSAADDPDDEEKKENGDGGSGDEDPAPVLKLLKLRGADPDNSELQEIVCGAFQDIASGHDIYDKYNIIVLFDQMRLHRMDANKIYNSLSDVDEDKPILLVLDSRGGDVAAAYLIGKLCREKSSEFVAAVPRQAKSGATLICCGADQIHMGSLSELGPIDPQLEGVPALALKYSIEHIAELSRRYPNASEMFSNYLSKSLDIEQLGYYERVAESATQYAERLLQNRKVGADQDEIAEIADRLVYQYKDHGFVIDSNESQEIFGADVVKMDTPEYNLADDLFNKYSFLFKLIDNFFDRHMYFTGRLNSGCKVFNPDNI